MGCVSLSRVRVKDGLDQDLECVGLGKVSKVRVRTGWVRVKD